jgi:hypothetical protein
VLYLAFHPKRRTQLRAYRNKELSRIFRPKRKEVTRKQRNVYNEELNNLGSSSYIIRINNSRRT